MIRSHDPHTPNKPDEAKICTEPRGADHNLKRHAPLTKPPNNTKLNAWIRNLNLHQARGLTNQCDSRKIQAPIILRQLHKSAQYHVTRIAKRRKRSLGSWAAWRAGTWGSKRAPSRCRPGATVAFKTRNTYLPFEALMSRHIRTLLCIGMHACLFGACAP